jgi:hypothetical protein
VPFYWDEIAVGLFDVSYVTSNFFFECQWPVYIESMERWATIEGASRLGTRILMAGFIEWPEYIAITENAHDTFDFGKGLGRIFWIFFNYET